MKSWFLCAAFSKNEEISHNIPHLSDIFPPLSCSSLRVIFTVTKTTEIASYFTKPISCVAFSCFRSKMKIFGNKNDGTLFICEIGMALPPSHLQKVVFPSLHKQAWKICFHSKIDYFHRILDCVGWVWERWSQQAILSSLYRENVFRLLCAKVSTAGTLFHTN